jgi:hypothetical protein
MKFVAFGMAAEIVVIVENENFRVGLGLAVEIRGAQAADAAAHHHQIEFLAGVGQMRGAVPEIAVAQFMRRFERAGMAAAHAEFGGWVIAGCGLRQLFRFGGFSQFRRETSGEGGDRRALQEVAPRDGAVEAEVFIFARHRSSQCF